MVVIEGKGVVGAVAIGNILFYKRNDAEVVREKREDSKTEIKRLKKAKEASLNQLKSLYEKATVEVGEAAAQIFEIHQMMICDEDYNETILNIIDSQKVNAEYAVARAADNFSEMFSSMDDEYMKARAADVKDISNRIIKNLSGIEDEEEGLNGKFIVCADDLTPSETVTLDKDKVLAFVTKYGSLNSHTAILARTMNIPAVIGVGEILNESFNHKLAAVDGFSGKVYIEPDERTVKSLRKKQEEDDKKRALLQELKGKEDITLDGTRINIFANIGGLSDIGAVLLNDASGIGLFRSEFLYLENEDYPTEQVQFEAYKKILESMAGKKVIIRTMDIGADKQIDYFKLEKEDNPALGFRAIRICLERKEIFKTQLRALLRASVYGSMAIMFPMIISCEEVREIKEILSEVKSELKSEGIEYDENIETGIMIETPAAALISDTLAQEVDFFSVGTNDLTQYTLAIDRQNPKLERFCNTHHEAVLKLIEMAADAAHRYGKWIGICGELAADISLTKRFLKMGIDELSVSPPRVLKLRETVRGIDMNE